MHIVQQGEREQEKVISGEVAFKGPTTETGEAMLLEGSESYVCMFVVGLSGLNDVLHLLFEVECCESLLWQALTQSNA